MSGDRILIVEDESIVAEDIRNKIENLGYAVVGSVSSGEACIAEVEKSSPDLILMDIRLDGKIDGVTTAEKLRQQYDIPIIYVTSYDEDTVYQRAKVTQPYGYITKPYDTSELRYTIDMALMRHKLEQELEKRIEERTQELVESNKLLKKEIHERKTIENNLLQTQERLSGFMKAAPDAFVLFDSEMNFIEVNDALLSYHPAGKNKTNIIGKRLTDIFPDIKGSDRYNKYLEVIQTGEPCYIEDTTPDPMFGHRYFNIRVFKVGDGLGMILRDVTKRKHTEQALRESEARMRVLLNAPSAFAALIDLDGTIVAMNDVGGRLFSKNADELIGSNVREIFPPELKELGEHRIEQGQRVIETGKPVKFHDIRQGRYIENSIFPVFDDDGNVMQPAVFSEDVTDLKRAENALERSELKYRSLVESSPDIICSVTQDGRIAFINNTIRRFGYDPKKLIGKTLDEVIYPLDKDLMHLHLLHKEDETQWQDEIRLMTKDGEVRNTLVNTHRVANTPGDFSEEGPLESIHVMRDVTEYWKIQKEKEGLQKQLGEAEKLATMGQFTSSIAHELNNSLDILMTKLFLLEKSFSRLESTESIEWEHVVGIKQQLKRMSHLSKNILDYAKPRSIEFRSVSMASLMNHVCESFSDRVSISAMLNLDIRNDIPVIQGDRLGLELVFKNILLNSFEALKKTGEIRVIVRKYDDAYMEVIVRDNGKGIPKKNIGKVFDPFFSMKRKTGGTGLGLPLCKHIVESHGGLIKIESQWNKGTTVTVRLPY